MKIHTKIKVFEATNQEQCELMNMFLANHNVTVVSVNSSSSSSGRSFRNYITILYKEVEE